MRLHFPFCSAAQFTTVKLYLSLLFFLHVSKKRKEKRKTLFKNENASFHGERFVLLSFCALDERGKERILICDWFSPNC